MFDLLIWVGWNVFLAIVPVALGYWIYDLARPWHNRQSAWRKVAVVAIGLVWLAFLPNTCYLLTEWRHFLDTLGYTALSYRWKTDSGALVDLMMHTLFYLCYSGVGMLTFTLAIRPIARLFKDAGVKLWAWGLPLFLLNSLGVYLGLVLRFNSWDMITRLNTVWPAVMEISRRPVLASFVLAFAAFLWVVYFVVDIWVDGFVARWREIADGNEHPTSNVEH